MIGSNKTKFEVPGTQQWVIYCILFAEIADRLLQGQNYPILAVLDSCFYCCGIRQTPVMFDFHQDHITAFNCPAPLCSSEEILQLIWKSLTCFLSSLLEKRAENRGRGGNSEPYLARLDAGSYGNSHQIDSVAPTVLSTQCQLVSQDVTLSSLTHRHIHRFPLPALRGVKPQALGVKTI